MRRLAVAALALAAATALPASAVAARQAPRAGAGDAVDARWAGARTHVALTMGTSDYQVGDVRVSFLVVARDGRLIEAPRARLSLARGMKERAFATGVATLQDTAPKGGSVEPGDVAHIFIGQVRAPGPGTYWLLAQLDGKDVAGLGNVVVREHPTAVAVGASAPASDTPTLGTVKDVTKLTTRTPPDTELLRVSVADALRRHQPFVVAFATPKFCSSRTCGPVVDVVDAVRKRWRGTPVQFIHVEIYAGNNPSKGPNRWVRQWSLPSEPWIFLVGRDGKVKARFEGATSEVELAAAIQTALGVHAP